MAIPMQDLAELAEMQRKINGVTTAEQEVDAPTALTAAQEFAKRPTYYYSKKDGKPTYGKGEVPRATRAKPPDEIASHRKESTSNTK